MLTYYKLYIFFEETTAAVAHKTHTLSSRKKKVKKGRLVDFLVLLGADCLRFAILQDTFTATSVPFYTLSCIQILFQNSTCTGDIKWMKGEDEAGTF